MIRVGVIGFGFMGRTHAGAYLGARDRCRLVAIAGRGGPSRNSGNFQASAELPLPDELDWFDDAEAMLASGGVDAVSICTPTPTHIRLAELCLEHGIHALIEKPVALTRSEIEPLSALARGRDTVLMPAMCMRFWPAWTEAVRIIRSGTLGGVRAASFERRGPPPDWSSGFYLDEAKSGGPLTDLHIHDTDFMVSLFGTPRSVRTTGAPHSFSTEYTFGGSGPRVTASGGWDLNPGEPFVMRFSIELELGALGFELGREHELHANGEPIPVDKRSAYELQAIAFLDSIGTGRAPPIDLDAAVLTARVLDAERESLAADREVTIG